VKKTKKPLEHQRKTNLILSFICIKCCKVIGIADYEDCDLCHHKLDFDKTTKPKKNPLIIKRETIQRISPIGNKQEVFHKYIWNCVYCGKQKSLELDAVCSGCK